MSILPGNYGCVAAGGVAAWIIQHGTASPYGHAFLVVDEARVLEARPGGVGYADLQPYVDAGAVFNTEEPLTDEFRAAVVAEAASLIGAPYDWSAILDLGLRCIGRKSELLPVGSRGKFICSQFVTVTATNAGKAYCPDADRWTVSPRTLADRITARSWEVA